MEKKAKKSGRELPEDFFDVKLAVLLSFLAWPLLYALDNGFEKVEQDNRTLIMAITGFLIFTLVPLGVAKLSKLTSWMGYVFILFVFTAMIDLIIALEYYNLIKGFMSHYLQMGEPYLHSAWGCAIALFDGTGFYVIYLILIHQISNGKSWRSTGLYWSSSILNSMVVLLFGVFAGRHLPTFCTFLNVPYALAPFLVFIRILADRDGKDGKAWNEEARSSFFRKILELLLALGLIFSIWVTFTKGMLALGSTFTVFRELMSHEPVMGLDDPAPFMRIQSLVYLFYMLPIQCLSLFYTFRARKPRIIWDLALMHAGVMLQGQFSVIVTAFDPNLKPELRSNFFDAIFWANNLSLLIVPHLFLWLLHSRHIPSGNQIKKVK